MKRKLYIRLSIFTLAISLSLMLFSYVHARASRQDEPAANECGNKCPNKKIQTEYILWESITRNLLMVKG